jgi:hypothetical protein
MNPKLHFTFEKIERQRSELLAGLRNAPSVRLASSPQGKWSILHILSHLMAGERTGLEYVRKKLLGVDSVGESGPYEEFKFAILVVSQRLPFLKYKAPKVVVDRTVIYNDLDNVAQQWDRLRGEWKAFLEEIPDRHVNRKIFRHVVAGRMNVDHGLRFFAEHVTHHMPQIEALLKADPSTAGPGKQSRV